MSAGNKIARRMMTASFMTLLALASQQSAEAQPAPATLSSSVHGVFRNTDGKVVEASPTLILQTQDSLIRSLQEQLSPNDRDAVEKAHLDLSPLFTTREADQVWGRALLIGIMIRRSTGVDTATYKATNATLLSRYATLIGKHFDHDEISANKIPSWANTPVAIQKSVLSFVDRKSLLANLGELLFPIGPYTYSQKCRADGVPVPPDWGSPLWVKMPSPLAVSYLTQPGDFPRALTNVYYYVPKKGPQGLCIALPIIQDTSAVFLRQALGPPPFKLRFSNKINALGIICQGQSTTPNPTISNSKACFWDNNGDLWPNTPYPINSNAFLAPPNLPNNNQCTDCHAGENAFITHPGTPLEAAKANFDFTSRNNWYSPKVQPGWPQNPEPGPYPSGPAANAGCGSCHNANFAGRLPNVTGVAASDRLFKFCNFLLPNELTPVVDPNHSPGQMAAFAASPQNAASVTALYNACRALFPPNPPATPASDPTVNIPAGFPASQAAWMNPVAPP